MKKLLFLTFLSLVSLSLLSQDYKMSDYYSSIGNYDLSVLWTAKTIMKYEEIEPIMYRPEPLGYIGDEYQRFYIHFISVIRNSTDPYEYFIYGKTKVQDNICDFQGTIRIKKASLIENPYYEKNLKSGKVEGEYQFFENARQNGTGFFKGKFASDFVIDAKGVVHYDAMDLYSDSYRNNQFEGTWESYATKEAEKCNWGDWRIPDSGDLDTGTAEFNASEVYYSNGWENFRHIHKDTPEGKAARIDEDWKWWLQ